MENLKVGDYVLTTHTDWINKGFTKPKRIFAIKNSYANLGDNFNSCYIGHLKKAMPITTDPIHEGEITLIFQEENNLSIRFWFGRVYLKLGLN